MSYQLPDEATMKKWLANMSDEGNAEFERDLRHDLAVAARFAEKQAQAVPPALLQYHDNDDSHQSAEG
ncbi:hypothetical protein [Schleiferilactobacillus shenzhenensis]|uniref:Uncharacterized protein n=1 Tax=Schleiferilactobacillus shenzhenensis LY-73 TaxID=1231336 RepID=U4TLQ9_9LACO|nr:hypothetical protein [Schleiferilactobacillus shenzhenensis]ERL64315.1 hypothetical protein L248_1083 [Schleiferilactobacillus shenzhenensis LY-73]